MSLKANFDHNIYFIFFKFNSAILLIDLQGNLLRQLQVSNFIEPILSLKVLSNLRIVNFLQNFI